MADKITRLVNRVSENELFMRMMRIQSEIMRGDLSPECEQWLVQMADADNDTIAQEMYCEYMLEHEPPECDWNRVVRYCHSVLNESPERGNRLLAMLSMSSYGGGSNPDKAMEYLEKAAEAGDVESCYKLAVIRHTLMPDEYDPEDIRDLIERTSMEGCSPEVWNILVEACMEMEDDEAAVKYIRRWVREFPKDAQAAMCMADMYASGRGVRRDMANALKYYQKASNLGDEKAMFQVGKLHYDGEGCRRNYSRAADYFRRAMAAGSRRAIVALARCYFLGHGLRADAEKGLQLLQQGAEDGVADCCTRLASLYFSGDVVERNLARAHEYIQQADKMAEEDIDADWEEILELKDEIETEIRQRELAVSLPPFLEKLKQCMADFSREQVDELVTEGVEKFLDVEAVRDMVCSMLSIKACSPAKAKSVVKMLQERMEENEDADAAILLGDIYYHGYGVKCDYVEAFTCYNNAWEASIELEACLRLFLGFHERNFTDEEQNAEYWLEELVECFCESPQVMYLQGLLHSVGLYLEEDKKKAEEFFAQAIEAGLDVDPQADLRAWPCCAKSLRQCLKLKG